MEIVTLILSILVAAGFITCICLRISKNIEMLLMLWS